VRKCPGAWRKFNKRVWIWGKSMCKVWGTLVECRPWKSSNAILQTEYPNTAIDTIIFHDPPLNMPIFPLRHWMRINWRVTTPPRRAFPMVFLKSANLSRPCLAVKVSEVRLVLEIFPPSSYHHLPSMSAMAWGPGRRSLIRCFNELRPQLCAGRSLYLGWLPKSPKSPGGRLVNTFRSVHSQSW